MLGVGRPSYSGRNATLSVQWQGSRQEGRGPGAAPGAVGPARASPLLHARALADQARDHAGPAAVRILVVGLGLEGDRLVAVLLGELGVLLPPLAVLVVPARVLELEPLEVRVVHAVDAPVVGEPAGGEE